MLKNEKAVLVSKNNITPPNTKKIYLVRHGNASGTGKIENLNPHLNDLGVRQAKSLKKILGNGEVDSVVTSNLHRTKETAKVITNLEPIALDKLNELHSGEGWEDILLKLNICHLFQHQEQVNIALYLFSIWRRNVSLRIE